MAVIIAITAIAAPTPARGIALAAVLIGGEAALLLAPHVRFPGEPLLLALSAVAGLVGMLLSPSGLAEVMVIIAGGRLPAVLSIRSRLVVTLALSLAFGCAVWAISGSPVGLLASLGVYFVAERAIEHRELVTERDRAVALAAELQAGREARDQAAAAEERERIAREMHDVLAHSLAGLSLQLQGLRMVASREGAGPALTEPLDRAAQLARDGVDEARAAVGALRGPDRIGIAGVPGLIERFPGDAHLTVSGAAGDVAAREVTAEVGHVVYRAIQEGLTNSARYAPGSRIDVTLDWAGSELRTVIADTGRAPGREPTGVRGGGAGLVGMGERLAAVGGAMSAAPTPSGGWRVELSVPALLS
jgi:signal transduction histidine kinase